MDLKFADDPVHYIREKVDLFIAIAQRDPVQAIKFVPEVAGGIGVLIVTILALLIGGLGAGAQKAPSKDEMKAKAQDAKAKAADAKDKVADSVSSGADAAQEEVKKRTTRSSAQ